LTGGGTPNAASDEAADILQFKIWLKGVPAGKLRWAGRIS
jgi:hypothetical protein